MSKLATVLTFVALFAAPSAIPVLAQGMQHGQMQPGQMQHDKVPADSPADKAFLGAMHDMMMGMHQSMPTGDTDKDFVRMMLPHHQAAVDMAKTELQYGADPDLKTLATEIVAAQDKEMAMMKAWQDKHAKSVP